MNILIFEHIQTAWQTLSSTRLRTLLTITGVTIGVASITTILSLGNGMMNIITEQIDSLDGNVAIVRPGSEPTDVNSFVHSTTRPSYNTSTLTEEDLIEIQKLPQVKNVAPIIVVNGIIKARSVTASNSTVVASTPTLADVNDLTVRDGQFIDQITNRDTAVIGNQLSVDLFGTDQSIGYNFTIRGQTFTVIGVLRPLNNPINFNNVDFDRTAIISVESGKTFHHGSLQIQQINVRAENVDKLPDMIHAINDALLKSHQNEKDFSIISGKEIARPTSQFFASVTGVMTIIAAISLIVGGIGIMNIMLVSVAERTREIGLRKSVGASRANIICQFMTEALIMSTLGGLLGYVIGYIVAFVISRFLPFDPAFSWEIFAWALCTSVIVGGIFGIYPALRAAHKDPIESLRQYH